MMLFITELKGYVEEDRSAIGQLPHRLSAYVWENTLK